MTYLGPDQSSDVLVKSSRQGVGAVTIFGAAVKKPHCPLCFLCVKWSCRGAGISLAAYGSENWPLLTMEFLKPIFCLLYKKRQLAACQIQHM